MTTDKNTAENNRLIFALIALAIIGRLIPHPDNFTPVAAVALFAGALLPGWRAAGLVLIVLAASDWLLGFAPGFLSLAVYAGFACGIALGHWLGSHRTWAKTGMAALGSSVLFFVITNFVVWAFPEVHEQVDYAQTWSGLVECYAMALPFLRNSIAGDLFWVAMLFGLYDFGRARMPAQSRPQRLIG